jgi:hypothetical protein
MIEPYVLRDDPIVRITAWKGVLFNVWFGASTPEVMREISHLEVEFAKKQEDRKFALVSIVRMMNITDFGPEVRKALQVRMQRIDPYLAASVTVLPSNSIASSIVRGIITGLSLVVPSKMPTAVLPTTDDACSWLVQHLPRASRASAEDLKRALGMTMALSSAKAS